MKNIDICHKFFYQGNEKTFNKSYKSVSYSDNCFYSYYTKIGEKITGKDNKAYLLLSYNTFSNTTAKHINDLRSSSPIEIIYTPVNYGDHYWSMKTCLEKIITNLDFYSKSKLSLKNNRDRFFDYFNMLLDFNEKIIDIDQTIIDQYQVIFDMLNNSESLKVLKANIRKSEEEKRRKLKEELNFYLNNYNLSELAKLIYDYSSDLSSDIRRKLKDCIDPKNDLAFVWIDGDFYKTSKHITIAKKDCENLINLFKIGKLKHGLKLNQYTVLEVTENHIKIGCHKIPVENINCLTRGIKCLE